MKKISGFPVMKKMCSTCPFKDERFNPELVARIKAQVLTKASQICHHPALRGKKQDHLCRGARDFQLMFFHRVGVLEYATDEAWENLVNELDLKSPSDG